MVLEFLDRPPLATLERPVAPAQCPNFPRRGATTGVRREQPAASPCCGALVERGGELRAPLGLSTDRSAALWGCETPADQRGAALGAR